LMRLKVAILGGLSRIKGADVVEDVAVLAAQTNAPLEFHLLGHAYRNLRTQPHAALTVHGAYQEHDLPRLLEWLKPDVVWFPAQWPETYSYTLSACLEAGLPVVVTDLGAFAERLNGRRWSWVAPWDQTAKEWQALFERVRKDHFVRGETPAPLFIARDANERAFPQWVHARDYLGGLAVQPTAALPQSVLQPGGPAHAGGANNAAVGLKGLALSSLVRLRATSGFRHVARAIPAHVQRRVKNWLLA
jgi:O-antigen biosynthesis protein